MGRMMGKSITYSVLYDKAFTKIFFQGKIIKQNEPFSIRHKEFWDISEARTLLGPKFTKASLGHEPDGLVFQPGKEVSGSILNYPNHMII